MTVTISREMAQEFLSLFAPADESHCFQLFDDSPRRDRGLARMLHGSFMSVFSALAASNEGGTGVFFTVNEVPAGRRRLTSNVVKVRALFADLDDPTKLLEAETAIAQRRRLPSIVVETSPGKRHFYWLVNDCPLEAFSESQKAIAAALGTDPAVCDLPRVMRVPGFIHRKGEPFLTQLVRVA